MDDLSNSLRSNLKRSLPPRWSFQLSFKSGSNTDARLTIDPPNGRPATFDVALKRRFEPRDIDQLERSQNRTAPRTPMMLVASNLSARSRELLRERDISHADLSGTLWISSDSLLLDKTGTQTKLTSTEVKQARTSLRGQITGRVVRFLCDNRPPLKVRGIALETGVNAGNVSRILDFLARERLVDRSDGGGVVEVDWQALIARWAIDLEKDREARVFLEPRGLTTITTLLLTLPHESTPIISGESRANRSDRRLAHKEISIHRTADRRHSQRVRSRREDDRIVSDIRH